jgi:hypothetical protein
MGGRLDAGFGVSGGHEGRPYEFHCNAATYLAARLGMICQNM